MQPELAEYPADVDAHRALGDGQLSGDAVVGKPAGEHEEHLALARGQPVQRRRFDVGRGRGPGGEALDEAARRARGHDRIAVVNVTDRSHELLQAGVLEEEAAGAGADRLEGVFVEVEGGQDQDSGAGAASRAVSAAATAAAHDAARRLDPVHPRHSHVHEDDVGLDAGQQLDGGGAVVGLPDELDVVLRLQQHVEAQPVHLLIIDQHDPDRHGSPFLIGRTARTRKPPSALGPVSRVPPWEATLSRMPTRP